MAHRPVIPVDLDGVDLSTDLETGKRYAFQNSGRFVVIILDQSNGIPPNDATKQMLKGWHVGPGDSFVVKPDGTTLTWAYAPAGPTFLNSEELIDD